MQDNFQHLHLCDEEYFVGKSAVNKDGRLFQGECNGCDEPLLIASHCLHGLPPGPLRIGPAACQCAASNAWSLLPGLLLSAHSPHGNRFGQDSCHEEVPGLVGSHDRH